ncbi:MAG: class I SAM-dependent methyltransferase [Oscillospiraceae bacterium]|nr:class I SAM-dependent methyltransferase [Oscillospiraceae bacterium]
MSLNWDVKYLKESRAAMWNDDYMEFLIEKVWKINTPVNIVDFGCGVGFMGLVFLPLLPKGSTYTGIDINKILLSEAKDIFKHSPYKTNFIEKDLLEYIPEKKYDIAICQTVLQHIPNPKRILEKMKNSVIEGGRIICVEIDTITAIATQYFQSIKQSEILNLSNYQKIVEKDEIEKDVHGGHIGMKIPVFMQELGLKDIDIRVNDYVQFINPMGDKEKHKKDVKSYMANPQTKKPGNREETLAWYLNRGYTEKEAEEQCDCQFMFYEYITQNINHDYVVNARCLFISYGIV